MNLLRTMFSRGARRCYGRGKLFLNGNEIVDFKRVVVDEKTGNVNVYTVRQKEVRAPLFTPVPLPDTTSPVGWPLNG